MAESIHKILLIIHIPFGFLSLILFWIPVGVKKGSPVHRKVGWYYLITMWVVVITALLLSICNIALEKYEAAAFLGYLSIITAYPIWYANEILNQDKIWSDRYFNIRRIFSIFLVCAGSAMMYMGAVMYHFRNMGMVIFFFGLLALPAIKDILMTKAKAMEKEGRMKMHIKGTIISGIAAYTAFFAFGGARFMIGVLHMNVQWMIVPWILPSLLGVIYMRYMTKKYVRTPTTVN